jgi:hypothetical protein
LAFDSLLHHVQVVGVKMRVQTGTGLIAAANFQSYFNRKPGIGQPIGRDFMTTMCRAGYAFRYDFHQTETQKQIFQ